MNIKVGMLKILIANLINLIVSMINGFILPKYLNIDTYAYIKLFQLYISYIGFAHLGFVDGIYLKYGGMRLNKLNLKTINDEINFFRLFQIVITLIFVLISLFFKDFVLFAFTLSIIPLNLVTLYKYVFQATGEFDKYSRILNFTSILTVIINLILVLILRIQDYKIYVIASIIINIVVLMIVEYSIRKIINIRFSVKIKLKNVVYLRDGFLLMLGNFSTIILTGLDRWFVKVFLTLTDFAMYSFAVSIEVIITTFISPVTVTLYNYFCKTKDQVKHIKIRDLCLVLSTYLISAAFIIKFIIEFYLPKYQGSINIIFVLFSTQIFTIIIKGIYINLYKVNKMQNVYFIKLVLIIILSVILNFLFFFLIKSSSAFSYATFCTTLLWLYLCYTDFKYIKYTRRVLVFMFLSILLFLMLGHSSNPIFAMFIYLFAITLLLFLCIKNTAIYLTSNLKSLFKKIKKR